MVDWAATEKYEKDRAAGASTPEAAELDKELEADREAEEALLTASRSRHCSCLRKAVFSCWIPTRAVRSWSPLDQRGGAVNKNMKGKLLRSAVNPMASARQTVEVPGKHSPGAGARQRALALHQH